MHIIKTVCLASLLIIGAAAAPAPAVAQSFEFGPGGLRIDPDGRDRWRGGDIDRRDAIRAARRNGLVEVDSVRPTRSGDWVVEGSDRRGRDMEVRVDGDTGQVIGIRR